MTTLVSVGKNTVTEKNDKPQIYLNGQKVIESSIGKRGDHYNITITSDNQFILTPKGYNTEKLKGTTLDKLYKISGKGDKPVLDIKIKQLPEKFVKGVKLKIVSMKNRLIITVHHEQKIEAREHELLESLANGKKVKVASIFSGATMREKLKRCGLYQLANDMSCQLAIELEPSALQSAMAKNADFWQEPSLAAAGNLTEIDFSKTHLPTVNGLIVDATQFDICTDKKAGKQRHIASDEDYDTTGVLFLTVIEVLKRTNPAFVNIEIVKPSISQKKEQSQKENNLSTIMTVFSSVLNSLGYNIEQSVDNETGKEIVSLLAISKGLSLGDITSSSLVACNAEITEAVEPTFIECQGEIAQNSFARTAHLISTIQRNKPLEIGSAFSGGGILDRSVHDGLEEMGLTSFCKFGIEWIEAYYNSNLLNNTEIWSDSSYFLLGDVRGVNVYDKPLPQVHGIAMGVPCIGASKAGLVKNKITCAEEHEIAGALFVSSIEIIKSSNPAFIILENVPGYQDTISMEIIRSVLNNLGYNISENVYAGNDFGALENRKRLVMIATPKGLDDDENLLNVLPPIVDKQNCLNDIMEDVPPYDKSWTYRDYFVSKALKDKARGVTWRHQTLTGEESHCGTIGRSYMKARSTEPFKIFDLEGKFAQYHERLNNGSNPHDIFNEIMFEPGYCQMYMNFSENIMKKKNRREGLKGDDVIESSFALALSKFTPSEPSQIFTGSKEDSKSILTSTVELDQFIEITYAISKATRLFTVNEHASVKRVPKTLVKDLPKTTAHEILGNGVVYSLFQSIGRRIAAFALNSTYPDSTSLLSNNDLKDIGALSQAGKPNEQLLNQYKFIKNTNSYYLIDKSKLSVSRINTTAKESKLLAA